MKKTIILSLLFLFQFSGFTQVQKDNQFNAWFTYSGDHKLNDNFSIHTLYSFRRNDLVKYWQQSLLRIGLSRKLTNNFIVTLGYDWVETFPYGKEPISKQTTEHRPFEQLILKNVVGRFEISHRYKLEQRLIESFSGFIFRNRFRYRFTLIVPINKQKLSEKTFYFSAFDEIFINTGKHINVHYFDQNWGYLGLGYQFNKYAKLAIGYMNQYLPKSDNIHIENNHTLMISWGYSFH